MLKCHSHFSLLRAFGSPEKLVERAHELGHKYCALTDYMSISGCIDFFLSCKKHDIKPILGCDFGDFTVLAKNKQGWQDLMNILSIDNPSFDSADIIIIKNNPACELDGIEIDCKPSYYIRPEDKEIHQILLSCRLNLDIPTIKKQLNTGEISDKLLEVVEFFRDDDFSVPTTTTSEMDAIAESVETYNILSEPKLPHFKCPNGISEIEYLKELCRTGWRKKLKLNKEEQEVYLKRILHEFKVIEKADLAGYFLIVQDFVNKSGEDGQLKAYGRGSAAGSLVSYLCGITNVDPIKYGLMFNRFYNMARSYPKHVNFNEYKFIDDFRAREE